MAFSQSAVFKKAYHLWCKSHGYMAVEENLKPFLAHGIAGYVNGKKDWLRTARQALLLSSNEVAQRLNITRQCYCRLEREEVLGAITIHTLQRAAEALGCELVYAIRPKTKLSFSETIWQKLINGIGYTSPTRLRTPKEITSLAKKLENTPQFRRQQAWTERRHAF